MTDVAALEDLVTRAVAQLGEGQNPSYVLGALAIDAYQLGSGFHPLDARTRKPVAHGMVAHYMGRDWPPLCRPSAPVPHITSRIEKVTCPECAGLILAGKAK